MPAHDIGIWLGAYGPRTLELAGRVADGWIPSFRGDVDQLAAMTRRLDDALAAAGRSPKQFRRVLNVNGSITTGNSDGMFNGPVGQWVDDLTEVAISYGFDTFIFWGEGENQLDLFAQNVVPATREQLATGQQPSG